MKTRQKRIPRQSGPDKTMIRLGRSGPKDFRKWGKLNQYLGYVAGGKTVTLAANIVGVSSVCVMRWREDYPEFASMEARALDAYRESIRRLALERATQPVRVPGPELDADGNVIAAYVAPSNSVLKAIYNHVVALPDRREKEKMQVSINAGAGAQVQVNHIVVSKDEPGGRIIDSD